MEHVVAAADAAGYADGVHAIFWEQHSALYHLSVLRQLGLFFLQRIHQPGHDLTSGQRAHLHQGECTEVSVSVFQKSPMPD